MSFTHVHFYKLGLSESYEGITVDTQLSNSEQMHTVDVHILNKSHDLGIMN